MTDLLIALPTAIAGANTLGYLMLRIMTVRSHGDRLVRLTPFVVVLADPPYQANRDVGPVEDGLLATKECDRPRSDFYICPLAAGEMPH